MSRGLGKWERTLLMLIRAYGKPVTFDVIRSGAIESFGEKFTPSVERAMRRALHGLVGKTMVIELGDGGRAEPFRYFIHPMVIGSMQAHKQPEAEALKKALEADPGAEAATERWMTRTFSKDFLQGKPPKPEPGS